MARKLRPAWSLLLLLSCALPGRAEEVPSLWQTRAEASGFSATSSLEETVAYLARLAGRSPAMRLETFGRSGEGRPMPLALFSSERAFTPAAARAVGKPVVLVISCIHGGEVDGKDASLLLLRDLALGRRPDLAAAATLLVVPVYNVDGHERVSPHNRPNQDGPVAGMGFRTTAQGLDLNRDFVKLESPEAQALVALVNAWRPHLVVDNHVTDGSDHAWVVTWTRPEAPLLPPELESWMAAAMPRVVAATEAAGFPTGPYVELLDGLDPGRGFSSTVAEPRLSTGYFPLRNRPTVLVETHSFKPFRERVEGNRAFLEALLAEVGRGGAALTAAVASAERRTVELGRPGAPPSELTLDWRAGAPDRALLPLRDWWVETSLVTGGPLLRYRPGTLRPVEVPWEHRVEPALSVPRPRGYLVLPGWPRVEALLSAHGLRLARLARAATLEVEALRVSEPRWAEASNQGRVRLEARVSRRRETRTVPAGTLWVAADQADFALAAILLEPEAPDSLLSWGLLATPLERKEYISTRVLEELATARLAADPALRAEWEAALADPAFAADPARRHEWWYRRTPHWDETLGLLPVLTLPSPLTAETRP